LHINPVLHKKGQDRPDSCTKTRRGLLDNTITEPHAKGETPFAIINLTPATLKGEIGYSYRSGPTILNVTVGVLLHRILGAAIIGQLYVKKIPEI
jgi:hypothetical protein